LKANLIFYFLFSVGIFAQPEIPLLKNWANDFSGTISNSELQALNSKLKVYEDSTSNQLVFLMIVTLNDYPIEYYAFEVAEKNKIGTKENDNGVLLVVAKDDRKLRIEVGYGLEGALPDALASSIIRNVIVPHFKKDNYYAGVNEGINAIIKAIAGEYTADPEDNSDDKPASMFTTLLMIIFFIIFFLLRGGRRRRGIVFFPGSFGGSKWSGGSGGFGGGFSGGGGSFGGGGASGSW
jgi:uncharacterized protein